MSPPAFEVAAAGAAAGLTIAATPGALTALLVDVATRDGARAGLAAGLGIATVDGLYAVVAVAAGDAARWLLAAAGDALTFACAGVLLAVAAVNLRRLRHPQPLEAVGRPLRRRYLRFAALTAVNPTTLALFTALVAGSATSILGSGAARVLFVAGVLLASASWHVALVAGGRALGELPRRAQLALAAACQLLVVGLAVRMVVAA